MKDLSSEFDLVKTNNLKDNKRACMGCYFEDDDKLCTIQQSEYASSKYNHDIDCCDGEHLGYVYKKKKI